MLRQTYYLTSSPVPVFPVTPSQFGQEIELVFRQDATGGRAVTWDASFVQAQGGAAPPQPLMTANSVTVYRFVNLAISGNPVWAMQNPPPVTTSGNAEAGNWRTRIPAFAASNLAPATSWTNELLMLNYGSGLGAAASDFYTFYLDPADVAASGFTTNLRLAAMLHTGSVASGVTVTFSLKPVATWTGPASNVRPGVASFGAAVLSTAFAAPAINQHLRQVSAVAAHPAAGWYALVGDTTAATAANSQTDYTVFLEYEHV